LQQHWQYYAPDVQQQLEALHSCANTFTYRVVACRLVSRAARLQVPAAVSTSKIIVKSNVTKEHLEVRQQPVNQTAVFKSKTDTRDN
jgi:hypothetical protein